MLPMMVLTFISSTHAVIADEDYNSLGRSGYAHWDCAAFGFLMEHEPASASRLFQSGYEKLGRYLNAAVQGKLTKENTSEVPIGLSWYFVSGPTIDFSLGYMWSKFSEEAYKETWVEFDEPSFEDQRKLQELNAGQKYQNKNCELLVP